MKKRPEKVRGGQVASDQGIHKVGWDDTGDHPPARFRIESLMRPRSSIRKEPFLSRTVSGKVAGQARFIIRGSSGMAMF